MTEITEQTLQPLMHNQHLEFKTLRERFVPRKAFKEWKVDDRNFQALNINQHWLMNAVQQCNLNGYDYDEILKELIHQFPNHNQQLHLEFPPRVKQPERDPKEFIEELRRWGYKPRLNDEELDTLFTLQLDLGICYVGDFLNAVNLQIRQNKDHINLFISKDPSFQKEWNKCFSQSFMTGNYPKAEIGKAELTPNGFAFKDPKEDD